MSDIKQYIKRGNGRKIGIMVAGVSVDNKVGFGWSLCSGNHGDVYDKNKALDIAIGRLDANYKDAYDEYFIPDSIKSKIKPFLVRMSTYYKNNDFSDFVKDLFFEYDIDFNIVENNLITL